jgi:predicted ferric reductase
MTIIGLRPRETAAITGGDARRSHRRTADLLEFGAVMVVAGAGALFLAGGGLAVLAHGDTAARLIGLGRLTGLIGTALLLVQLLLSARLPWVDRCYGHDRALVAHRRLSRVALPLLLAHAGAIILGHAAAEGLSVVSGWLIEPVRLLRGGEPDMLTAFAAMAMLILVAITSVRAAKRRASHETWHLVHLTGYIAVALSLPHQLSAGTDIAGHPKARLYWLALYLLTAGAVIIFRVLLPVWRSLRHLPRVEAVVVEGPGVVSVIVTGRDLHRLPIRAGQFLHWRFLTPGLWAAAHPWSISAAPDGRRLRLTVRDLGDHSKLLAGLRVGTRVLIEGPYGAFTTERRTHRRVLLIAAGIGITPIRALAEELAAVPYISPGDLTLLYRANDERSLVFREELDWLARHTPTRVELLVGPSAPGSWLPAAVVGPTGGRTGTQSDAAILSQAVPYLGGHDVYLCGPPAWMALVRRSLVQAGVAKDQIHDERFGW